MDGLSEARSCPRCGELVEGDFDQLVEAVGPGEAPGSAPWAGRMGCCGVVVAIQGSPGELPEALGRRLVAGWDGVWGDVSRGASGDGVPSLGAGVRTLREVALHMPFGVAQRICRALASAHMRGQSQVFRDASQGHVVAHADGSLGLAEGPDDIRQWSLAELVVASAMLRDAAEGSPDGSWREMMCSDRLVAALYAHAHVELPPPNASNPGVLAVGDGKALVLVAAPADATVDTTDAAMASRERDGQ